ncbi:MAG: hypothetical protein JWO12_1318 [Frankiales bacterium]|nr:hypothetical protein [Frankiales bacterium]
MTALSTEALLEPRPVLRVVQAPLAAPPYDDEPGAPLLRLVLPVEAPVSFVDDTWADAERTPAADLPGAKAFAAGLLHAVLEVLAGVRPVKQLRRDIAPEAYTALADSLPLRPRVSERPTRRALRSLHVQERPEGVAEVCATVKRGDRMQAIALRLEGMDGRWKCTDLVGV